MIHLTVALPAEARPLMRHFGLKAVQPPGPFPVYRGDDIDLVVTGPGRTAAAAATGWLAGLSGDTAEAGWLNVGVAGHHHARPGTAFLVHRIEDAATGRRWYPPQLLTLDCASLGLVTVDRPETNYPGDTLYDMEAAAFFDTATRFSTAELVQVIKTVSDNRAEPTGQVTARRVQALVGAAVAVIEQAVGQLHDMARELAAIDAPPPELERFVARWRFSVTQRHQLAALLRRWQALHGTSAWSADLDALPDAGAVLKRLAERLEESAA